MSEIKCSGTTVNGLNGKGDKGMNTSNQIELTVHRISFNPVPKIQLKSQFYEMFTVNIHDISILKFSKMNCSKYLIYII